MPAPRVQIQFMADQAALIALLQHEARISHAYREVRRRNTWQAAIWGAAVAGALAVWGSIRSATVDAGIGAPVPGRAMLWVAAFLLAWLLFAATVLSPPGFYRLVDRIIQHRVEMGSIDYECGPQVVTLVDEGIVCDGLRASSLALWSEVERIVPESDAIYFDLLSGGVLGVPRTAFRNDEEFRRFLEFACARLGAARSGNIVD